MRQPRVWSCFCVRTRTHARCASSLRPRSPSPSLKCPNTCFGFSFCYSLWEREALVVSPSPLSCHHRPWRRAEGTFPGCSRCRCRWLCPAHRKRGGDVYFSPEHLHIPLLFRLWRKHLNLPLRAKLTKAKLNDSISYSSNHKLTVHRVCVCVYAAGFGVQQTSHTRKYEARFCSITTRTPNPATKQMWDLDLLMMLIQTECELSLVCHMSACFGLKSGICIPSRDARAST